jgi:hypothetical protein
MGAVALTSQFTRADVPGCPVAKTALVAIPNVGGDRMRGHSHLWGSFDTRLAIEGDKEALTTIMRVNRHKDHDSKGAWAFKLVPQAPDEHLDETSLILLLDSRAVPPTKAEKAKAAAKPKEEPRQVAERAEILTCRSSIRPDSRSELSGFNYAVTS